MEYYKSEVARLAERTVIVILGKAAWEFFAALHLAAERGYTSILKAFLSSVNVNLNVMDSTGITLLLKAVKFAQMGAVELLLGDQRVDINQTDFSGNTALLTVIIEGQLPLAQLFLDRSDLKVNDINAEGAAVLIMATSLACSLGISKLLRYPQI